MIKIKILSKTFFSYSYFTLPIFLFLVYSTFLAGAHGGFGERPDNPFIKKEVSVFSPVGMLEMTIFFLFVIFLAIEIGSSIKKIKANK